MKTIRESGKKEVARRQMREMREWVQVNDKEEKEKMKMLWLFVVKNRSANVVYA